MIAALGAVAGTLCDRMHFLGGAVLYRSGALGGQPLWVPPLFAGAALGLVYGHRFCCARFGAAPPLVRRAELAAKLLLFLAAYAATALWHAHPWLLVAALGVGFVPLAARERYRGFLPYALGCGLAGISVEGVLTSAGAFAHARPELFGVPLWLPLLYLWAGLFGAALDRFLLTAVARTRAARAASP